MKSSKQPIRILLCPDAFHLYKFHTWDKNCDYVVSLTNRLDYEALNDEFYIQAKAAKQPERMPLHDFCDLISHHQVSVMAIFCSLSVSEYLSMLYYVSLCKDIPIKICDLSQKRAFAQDNINGSIYCLTCNEADEALHQATTAAAVCLTDAQKEAYHRLWLTLKDQNGLKGFRNAQDHTITLYKPDAFDEAIKQMIHKQCAFPEIYQYFLTNYGLSEQWLNARLTALNIHL